MSIDLTHRHSFRLKARANDELLIRSEDDLKKLKQLDNYLILAGGTNTLFVEDYAGTIVRPDFTGIDIVEHSDSYQLRVGANENWHDFVTYCLHHNIRGFENLALIPGTVGAAPVQNIGAYGREVSEFITSVECYSLVTSCTEKLSHTACQFGYRESLFKRHPNQYLITRVNFSVPKDWLPMVDYGPLQALKNQNIDATSIYQAVIDVRREKLPDPAVRPNAGSFFKNPVVPIAKLNVIKQTYPDIPSFSAATGIKVAAGWMIDRLGLRGTRCGNVAVHDKQALVLVNLDHGTGQQVIELCQKIRRLVLERYQILLEPEVRLIGRHGLMELPDPGADTSE
jgi:UDP-N-acetylmuramate dehydrogenase